MKSYESLAANIAAIEKLGGWIAKSQMFGCSTVDQGCVIASQVFITGMPLMEYQKRNMLVSGKPAIPYDAMIAAFQEAGGKIKVVEKTPDAARIELTFDGNTTPFAFTWEQAKQEPLPYNGKEADIVAELAANKTPKLKAKYATPRSRSVMLFARCVSDGIRTVAARVNFGTYTPEEIEDFAGTDPDYTQPATVAAPPPPAKPEAQPAIPTKPASPPPVAETKKEQLVEHREKVDLNRPSTQEQREKAVALMQTLYMNGVTDIVQRVSGKIQASGIEGILGLTYGEAQSLIIALEKKDMETFFTQAISGHKRLAEGELGNDGLPFDPN
jgi:hypothetical protein